METMLSVVCKTNNCVKALEEYDMEGLISKTSGLHGLGASIERPLDGRFLAICLENLRFVIAKFICSALFVSARNISVPFLIPHTVLYLAHM